MKNYDHKKIEKKWQKEWEAKGTYKTLNAKQAKAKKLKPYYVLDMFPYPSGAGLHVGHPRGYIASDVFARMKRMEGYNVLHPMGFDSFGLPAEQYAIKTGKNPGPFTNQLVKRYREQLSILGFSYDWDRQVATHDPAFYKWTQWIFLKIYNSYYDTEKNKARPISELVKKFEKTDKNWKNLSEVEKQKILMNYRLAYEGFAEVNWCPEMGTVLANDEVVEKDGKLVSERGEFPVEKKSMRQWFMRITSYADRLISGLDTIDWPDSIKEIQRNWIGKSEGSEITFYLENKGFGYFINNVDVFTTRADTLFGVSYIALAIDHPLVKNLTNKEVSNWDKVIQYIEEVSKQDRMNVKEITGIKLEGIVAKQSFMDIEVPVYLTNYVLGSYGTGAVMGVPAHDERDFEFANKYNLPIKQVIEPVLLQTTGTAAFKQDEPVQENRGIIAVIKHWSEDKYLGLHWPEPQWGTWLTGGIDEGFTPEETVYKEILEETGFKNAKIVKSIGMVHSRYYHAPKKVNRLGHTPAFLVELSNGEKNEIEDHESKRHVMKWLSKEEMKKFLTGVSHLQVLEMLDEKPYTGSGILTNSGEFNGLESEEARKKITDFVKGRLVTKFRMRDAIFARQRYWGEPIPLIHGKDGMISEVSEKNLPLELPKVASYEPTGTGESPLAGVKSWVNAGYETNTMPGWAGSSWYFLRYADPKNKKAFADESELDYWFNKKGGGVDMYVGGAEHATGHLLYSRFWHKFLFDLGYVKTDEPFKALRNQGMIGGTDGRKMSKRWGNVINPDDVVRDLGADTMRVYEAFMGPFEAALPWSTDGIVGSRRFIERVWRLQEKVSSVASSLELQKTLHKTVKKVTDDIQSFGFNTAVSSMMIFLNAAEKAESISKEDFGLFLQILAPFAPHITDELWSELGNKKSIHISSWPIYNPKLLIDDSIKMGIQVNGKVRAEIEVTLDATEDDVRNMVMQIPDILKWTEGKEIKKFIFIPKKIISIVAA
jgi:leucyl-tRNA synthetase